LLSAHPQHARAHLVAEKLSRGGEQVTPLLLLLRKYVLGGRLVGVEQPALERVLVLSIAKEPHRRNERSTDGGEQPNATTTPAEQAELLDAANTSGETLYCELIAELMDQRSNVILIGDDNIVLGSVKRVTAHMSSRQVVAGLPYTLPPRQDKLDPRTATGEGMRAAAARPARGLAHAIVSAYRGVSPQVAREALFRATGQPDLPLDGAAPHDAIAASLCALYQPAARRPSLVYADGQPRAYAAYALEHWGGGEAQPSMSAALDAFYTPREGLTAHRQRRDALRAQLGEARARLEKQRDSLRGELVRADDLERLRWEGEMIFGYLHAIAPRQQTLDVAGATITLDPSLSAVENAQARFRAYDKAKGALRGVPERLEATEHQLAAVDELLVLADLAEGFDALQQIEAEAAAAGFSRRTPGSKKLRTQGRAGPLSLRSRDGLLIYIGRSATQNIEVTFRLGRKDDLWLHTRQIPGAHVIVRREGGEVPEQTLCEAASYAAYYSGARGETSVDVDVCRRSLVRRIPNGPPGLVSYQAEQTLRVAPQRPPE
jgi:predicted ribosome quality control (RQC) complex YloA/Tae2 family protein